MTVHADMTNVAAAIPELSKFVLPIDVTKDLSRRNSSNFHTYSKTRVGRAVPRFQGILVVLMPLAQSEAMCRATPKPSTSPGRKNPRDTIRPVATCSAAFTAQSESN